VRAELDTSDEWSTWSTWSPYNNYNYNYNNSDYYYNYYYSQRGHRAVLVVAVDSGLELDPAQLLNVPAMTSNGQPVILCLVKVRTSLRIAVHRLLVFSVLMGMYPSGHRFNKRGDENKTR